MEKTRNGNNYNKIEVEKQFLFTLDQLITGDSWKCIDEIFFLNRPSRLKLPNKIAFSRADKEELITIFFLFCFIKGQNFICIPEFLLFRAVRQGFRCTTVSSYCARILSFLLLWKFLFFLDSSFLFYLILKLFREKEELVTFLPLIEEKGDLEVRNKHNNKKGEKRHYLAANTRCIQKLTMYNH